MKLTVKAPLFFLLVAIILSVFSSACGGTPKVSAEELCLSLNELFPDTDRGAVMLSDKASEDESGVFSPLTDQTIGRLYTGLYEPPSCRSRIDACAVRLPIDESGFEIHVLCALNPSDVQEITALLDRRLQKMKSAEILQYAPDEYKPHYENAEIFTKGNYVFLLATPDNTAAKKLIREKL